MTDAELESRFSLLRAELKNGHYTMDLGYSTVPGTRVIELRHRDMPMPLGCVWFRQLSDEVIEILHSNTIEWGRRCGVRTALHNRLFEYWPGLKSIVTGNGTESGAAWMRATGYKETAKGWEFRRKAKTRA